MRKLVVAVIGGTLLLLGIVMVVLPGPAVVVVPAGLAVLATEFLWARRALQRCKGMATKARRYLRWLRFPRNKSDLA
jgi:tellurite resistance protein TerC